MIDRRSGDVLTASSATSTPSRTSTCGCSSLPSPAALAVGLGCVVLGTFDPWLGLVLLAYLLVAGVALPLATRRLGRRPAGALVDTQGEMGAVIVEGLTGIGELVAYGRTDLLVDRLDTLTARQAADRRELAVARGLAASLTVLLLGLSALSVLIVGIALVGDGSLDPVLLAVLPLVAIATFEAVGPVTAAYEHLDRCRAASARLVVVRRRPGARGRPSRGPPGRGRSPLPRRPRRGAA